MGKICLGSNDSRINPHMRAKFGCSQTVVSKNGGGGTGRHTHTQRDTAVLYSRLAGYPASLGPLPLCLLPRIPPSSPPLPLSILGLPGFPHNICVIIIAFLKVTLKFGRLQFPTGLILLSICRQIMKFPGALDCFTLKTSPPPPF